MSQPKYIVLELLINKFSEFIEWLFEKKEKSELNKINKLNIILKNQIDLSIFDISEITLEELKIKLEKVDSKLLEDVITRLFKVSISEENNQTFQKIKSNVKLNKRIMELILYSENRFDKLSLELLNIKNSLEQMLKTEKALPTTAV